ncbi:hypothetical protein [Caulobacter segnis]|uniref:hypothetical protein n=1 Tax=Caulobacter segnis TaxID=88688 RepID=UPI002863FA0B|nr:hypothetical protein [Caulobacter segnis]MDR6624436.1 hypothetical protein [Caulobacter segnis]
MFFKAKPVLLGAFVLATAAPPAALAAPAAVRDVHHNPCRLVTAPFNAHKSPYRTSQYRCAGLSYSVFDPRLERRAGAADGVADEVRRAWAR